MPTKQRYRLVGHGAQAALPICQIAPLLRAPNVPRRLNLKAHDLLDHSWRGLRVLEKKKKGKDFLYREPSVSTKDQHVNSRTAFGVCTGRKQTSGQPP